MVLLLALRASYVPSSHHATAEWYKDHGVRTVTGHGDSMAGVGWGGWRHLKSCRWGFKEPSKDGGRECAPRKYQGPLSRSENREGDGEARVRGGLNGGVPWEVNSVGAAAWAQGPTQALQGPGSAPAGGEALQVGRPCRWEADPHPRGGVALNRPGSSTSLGH